MEEEEERRKAPVLDSLVCAAESVALTHGDVRLVHGPHVGLGGRDDTVVTLSAAHSPPVRGRDEMRRDEMRWHNMRVKQQRKLCLFRSKVVPI